MGESRSPIIAQRASILPQSSLPLLQQPRICRVQATMPLADLLSIWWSSKARNRHASDAYECRCLTRLQAARHDKEMQEPAALVASICLDVDEAIAEHSLMSRPNARHYLTRETVNK
ncbi:hypothetical protein MRB53_038106 [Persea americana]|nr:hypothetical protein MRB53_038106 [Persea americana]